MTNIWIVLNGSRCGNAENFIPRTFPLVLHFAVWTSLRARAVYKRNEDMSMYNLMEQTFTGFGKNICALFHRIYFWSNEKRTTQTDLPVSHVEPFRPWRCVGIFIWNLVQRQVEQAIWVFGSYEQPDNYGKATDS